jgi:ATP synthase subunit C
VNPTSPNLRAVAQTWWIIWGAMNVSLLMFAFVLHQALRPEEAPPAVPEEIGKRMSLVAVALAIGAMGARRYLQSDARVQSAAERSARSPTDGRQRVFLAEMQTGLIISLALHEAIGLVGFVIALVYREPARFWPFLGAAVAMNLLVMPRPLPLLERARALCPQIAGLALLLALCAGCSFTGGDFTPLKTEPETPCLKEANEICKEKLKSADIGNCVAREKYRCELEEQEDKDKPATPGSS